LLPSGLFGCLLWSLTPSLPSASIHSSSYQPNIDSHDGKRAL
jgi:hypothetical protein